MELSQSQNTTLLDALPRDNVVVSRDGVITSVDDGFKRALEAESREFVGRDLSALVYPVDYEQLAEIFEQFRSGSGDSVRNVEFRAQAFNGDWHVFEAVVTPLPDKSAPGEFVLCVRDITERKSLIRELEAENDRLQEFARMVSHDIRTPLQIAKGHVEQAVETGSDESFRKIRESHERIETIISDMLTLARRGSPIDDSEPVSLAAIARTAWGSVNTGEMVLEIRDDTAIEAQPDRLQQLFENLFRNAAEHAGRNATVVVAPLDPMATATRPQERLPSGFFVSDDGPGIPDELKETVFESGFSTSPDGTGFGLAIVKQIAEAFRWETQLKDAYIGGARFEFVEVPDRERLAPTE